MLHKIREWFSYNSYEILLFTGIAFAVLAVVARVISVILAECH